MNRRDPGRLPRRPRIESPLWWNHNLTVELVVPAPATDRSRRRMLAVGTTPGVDPDAEWFAVGRRDPRPVLASLPSPDEAVKRSRRPSFRCSDDEDPGHGTDDTLPLGIELPEP